MIQNVLKSRIYFWVKDEETALKYIDKDNLKSYNYLYHTSTCVELIRMCDMANENAIYLSEAHCNYLHRITEEEKENA